MVLSEAIKTSSYSQNSLVKNISFLVSDLLREEVIFLEDVTFQLSVKSYLGLFHFGLSKLRRKLINYG